MEPRELVIVGSGPAGFTAAIYAARAQLAPLLFEGLLSGPPGGQLTTTTEVENFPGFAQGVTGPELMDQMRAQAVRFGTELLPEDVISVDLSSVPFQVSSKKRTVPCHSLIIATGAEARRLQVEGTRDGEFWQKGVTACAICDGAMPIFRDRDLYVVGGGDTAVEEALFLTKYGRRVYMIHRRDHLRASKIMADRVLNHEKIEIVWNCVLKRVEGDGVVNSVTLTHLKEGRDEKREAGGLFFAIGHRPNTEPFRGQVEMDAEGYIRVTPGSTSTNIEGVFAAGDVQDRHFRQAVTAAGSGCMAALEAERWLSARVISS